MAPKTMHGGHARRITHHAHAAQPKQTSDTRLQGMAYILNLATKPYTPLVQMKMRDDAGLNSPFQSSYGEGLRMNGTRAHRGWDLQAVPNTKVLAVAMGEITAVGYHSQFGNYVKLKFRDGKGQDRYAFYAHLNSVSVKVGEFVWPRAIIGLSGGSGMPEAKQHPHLHFELHTEQGINGMLPAGPHGRLDPGEWLGYEVYSCDTPNSEEQQ